MDRCPDKYRALQEAALAITSELSLERVLHKIVDAARDLVQAKYAALGIAQADGKGLSRFIPLGLTEQEIAVIGEWPRGLGLLGVLLRDPKPLRVRRIANDPHSVGFPPGHPPMTSFLGVPVISKGKIFGNFYLTDKVGAEEFSKDDEELIVALAAFAAVTIDNATLYTETDARLRDKVVQLEKAERRAKFLLELSALLPTGPLTEKLPLEDVLAQASTMLGDACGVSLVWPRSQHSTKLFVHRIPGRAQAAEDVLAQLWKIINEQVVQQGRSFFIADIDAARTPLDSEAGQAMRAHGFTAGILVPIRSASKIHGVFLSLASHPLKLTEEDFLFGQILAARLATAVENQALLLELKDAVSARDESIAEFKRAEKSLAQFVAIVQSSDDAIYAKTLDGMITSWNPGAERLYGYAVEEIVGKSVAILIPSDRSNELPESLERVKCGERTQHFETIRVRKDGSSVPVSVSISPIKDNSGVIIGASTIARDITERKRADRFRDEYISLVSHDLRNPLTALTGQVEWLQRSLDQHGLGREAIGAANVLKSARRMNLMIQELVDSARLEAGRLEMHKVPTDLRRLVADTVEHAVTGEDKARVHIEAGEVLPSVMVDPERTERAIMNLLSNALKYSAPDAPVVVRLEQQGDKASICVADEGAGIPAGEQRHLFERYYRASTAGKQEGLGLGLYITRLIAEAHAGRVVVESEVGKGSTFCLSLPVV